MKTSRFIWRIFLVPLVTMLCAFFVAPLQAQGQSVEAYVQMSADKTTLTFYYDTKRATREGTTWGIEEKKEYNERQYPAWVGTYENPDTTTTKAVVDASFANFRPTSTASWFQYLKVLTNIEGLQYLNTTEVKNMGRMFSGCYALTSLNLSNFNTSNVTDMGRMFSGCSALTTLDLKNFNTSNVTDMGRMFSGCFALTTLGLKNFNTSNVTDMSGMFTFCYSLTELDLSSFNTSNVTDMSGMFDYCPALTSLNLSSFNTSNVANMIAMFSGCSALKTLDLSNFNTKKVTDMYRMFDDCKALTSLDLKNFNTQKVRAMSRMFAGCKALTSLNLKNFNTEKVEYMAEMFSSCESLTTLDLSNFNTSNVKYMSEMFKNCANLSTVVCDKVWSAPHSEQMFYGCVKLLGKAAFDTNKTSVEMANPNSGYFVATKPTALLSVFSLARANGIYTLQGKRVRGNLQHLPAGIYIVNGKKVVVQ